MSDTEKKVHKRSFIRKPLSSYYPSPFKVNAPALQNEAPKYYGHGAVYVSRNPEEEQIDS